MKKLIVLCAASLALAACAKGGHSLDPIANAQAKEQNEDLQGNWTEVDSNNQACNFQNAAGWLKDIVNGDKKLVVAQKYTYKFVGTNVTRVLTLYTDDKCTKPAVQFDESGTFTSPYNVNGSTKTSDGIKAKYIKLGYSDLTLAALTPEGQAYINSNKLCGQTDIKVGQANAQNVKNSAGSSCFGDKVQPVITAYSKDGAKLILAGPGATEEKDVPNNGKTVSAITLTK